MVKSTLSMQHFLFLLMTLMFTSVSAEVKTAESIHGVKIIIDEALQRFEPGEIMAVFDVDHTLTYPDHAACNYPMIKKHKSIYKNFHKNTPPVERSAAFSLMTQVIPQKLIDKDAPKVISEIQAKGIKTMALTATLAGKIPGLKDKIVTLRRDQLQKLGIDFSPSFKGRVIPNLGERYGGDTPTFYHGFMCSNGEGGKSNKGNTFVALLKVIGSTKGGPLGSGYVPKCVIFVDDLDKNIEVMEKELKAHDPKITFIGVKFTGAMKIDHGQDLSEAEFSAFWEKLIQDPRVKGMCLKDETAKEAA